MATGRAIFQAHVDGLLPESLPFEFQWTFPAAIGQIQPNVTWISGDNTLVVPPTANVIILSPPTTNAMVLKLKGAAGDTGITLQPDLPTILAWTSGPVIINASGTVNGVTVVFL